MSTTDNYHRRKDHLTSSASFVPIIALSTVIRKLQSGSDMVKDTLVRTWGELEPLPEKSKMIMMDDLTSCSIGNKDTPNQMQVLLFMTQRGFQSSASQVQHTSSGTTNEYQSKVNKAYETPELNQRQRFKCKSNLNGISMRQPCDHKGIVKSKGNSLTVYTNSFQSETKGFGSIQCANTTIGNTCGQLRDCDLALAKLGHCGSLSKSRDLRATNQTSNAIFKDFHANYQNSELSILPAISWLLQVNNISELLMRQAHAIKSLISLVITVRYLVLNAVLEAIKSEIKNNNNHTSDRKEKLSQEPVVLSNMEFAGNMNYHWGEGEGMEGDWGDLPLEGDHHADDELQEVPDFGDFSDDESYDGEEAERRMNQGADDIFEEPALRWMDPAFLVPHLDEGVPQFHHSPDLLDEYVNEPMVDPVAIQAILEQLPGHEYPIRAPPQNEPDLFLEDQVFFEEIFFDIDIAHAG
ncbi:unnamed protein product [Orchesella dallaii]|uniref:Uncharacterized protein n=1 Tax=Orchesella dallaii TaxID=48710 RepID=A0ABP1RZM3_9HEXA